MTAKHFRKIAEILRVQMDHHTTPEEQKIITAIAVNLTDVLRDVSPRFDVPRFLAASGVL